MDAAGVGVISQSMNFEQLDTLIDKRRNADEYEALPPLIEQGLRYAGQGETYFFVVQAKYLWIVYQAYEFGRWPEMETYATFEEWVTGYYQRVGFGGSARTAYGLVRLWDFWHEQAGQTVEWMVKAGKTKLQKMTLLGAKTMDADGQLDPLLKDVLSDEEVGEANVVETYEERVRQTPDHRLHQEVARNGGGDLAAPLPSFVSYRLHTSQGSPYRGRLEVWRDNQVQTIGTFHVEDDNALPDILELCERAGVKLV